MPKTHNIIPHINLAALRAYNPKDPNWNMKIACTALSARTQAVLIVLRYRDHHASFEMYETLSKVADAIRILPVQPLKKKDNGRGPKCKHSV